MIYGKLTEIECFNEYQYAISRALVEIIKRFAGKKDSVLEIGSSYGQNLDTLKREGFKKLTALEPDEEAFKGIKHKKFLGTLDDLEDLPEFDIIFTKSVLYLIEEPDYQEIVNKTKKYLILCEGEIYQHEVREWLHDRSYQEIFEKLGMEQVLEVDGFIGNLLLKKGDKLVDSGINGTKIRVFKK